MTATQSFASYDGVEIALHVVGEGEPLVVVPGGPGRPSGYLGDLGGLAQHRQLILMDLRGTGDSETPADESTYRVDRHAEDLSALVAYLDRGPVDILAHSAGCNVAMLLAVLEPKRVAHLVLVTPSTRLLGVPMGGVEEAMAARASEPWYHDAKAASIALEKLPTDADPGERNRLFELVTPFFYGRWDEAARAHALSYPAVAAVAAGFYRRYVSDPPALRAQLVRVSAPTLVVAGAIDAMPTPETAAKLGTLFPKAQVATVPGGHYPWLDDPAAFVETITGFLPA